MVYFPGYGWLTPVFDGRRSLIPAVRPVSFPVVPAGPGPGAGLAGSPVPGVVGAPPMAGGATPALASAAGPAPGAPGTAQLRAPGTAQLRAPQGGSPLSALAGTPLGPHLAQLAAQAPHLAGAGPAPFGLPQVPPGMPQMPPPPATLFGGPGPGGPTPPVRVPEWFGQLQPPPPPRGAVPGAIQVGAPPFPAGAPAQAAFPQPFGV